MRLCWPYFMGLSVIEDGFPMPSGHLEYAKAFASLGQLAQTCVLLRLAASPPGRGQISGPCVVEKI